MLRTRTEPDAPNKRNIMHPMKPNPDIVAYQIAWPDAATATSIATMLLTAVLAFFTYRLAAYTKTMSTATDRASTAAEETNRLAKLATIPEVIIYPEIQWDSLQLFLVLENASDVPAYDVKVTFDDMTPRHRHKRQEDPYDWRPFFISLPVLAPRARLLDEITLITNGTGDFLQNGPDISNWATIEFKAPDKTPHTTRLEINDKQARDSRHSSKNTVRHLSKGISDGLAQINDTISKSARQLLRERSRPVVRWPAWLKITISNDDDGFWGPPPARDWKENSKRRAVQILDKIGLVRKT